MHDDTAPHDHDRGLAWDLNTLIERRRVLAILAGAGLATLAAACGSSSRSATTSSTSGGTSVPRAAATPTSVATTTAPATVGGTASTAIPEETAGPYPGDGSNGPDVLTQSGVVRRDIRSSIGSSSTVATGVPTTIELTIVDAAGGKPLSGAAVYLWHCDRAGRYSMYSAGVTNENYLRGVQVAGTDGSVTFTSIFPACYSGRWPHIHYEVYASQADALAGRSKLATSQLALPEAVCRTVYATSGYSASIANLAAVSLATDNVFSDGAAAETPTATGTVADGLTLSLTVPVAS